MKEVARISSFQRDDGSVYFEMRWKEAKPETQRKQQWFLNVMLTEVLNMMDKVNFPEEPWKTDLDYKGKETAQEKRKMEVDMPERGRRDVMAFDDEKFSKFARSVDFRLDWISVDGVPIINQQTRQRVGRATKFVENPEGLSAVLKFDDGHGKLLRRIDNRSLRTSLGAPDHLALCNEEGKFICFPVMEIQLVEAR